MTQSITTRYHGPTNSRAAYMMAKASGGRRKRFPIRYETGIDENHSGAAFTLAVELGWPGQWQGAALNDKGDMVWVNTSDNFAPNYRFEV